MGSAKNDLFDIFDFNYLVNLFTKNWHWFLGSVMFSLMVAFVYLKITPKVYEVSTSIIIHEGTNSVEYANEQVLRDNISFISSRTGKDLENELMVLRSSRSIEEAIKGLDLQISYFQRNHFIKKELYKSAPFLVILNPDYPQPIGCEFMVEILNDKEFEITVKEKDEVAIINLAKNQLIVELPNFYFKQKGEFNRTLQTENMEFKLLLNSNFNQEDIIGKTYSFRIYSQKEIILGLQLLIEFFPLTDNIMGFSMETTDPQKAIDILSSLTYYYTHSELEKKLNMMEKTIDYIDNQLYSVQGSLRASEAELQQFQSTRAVTNLSKQAGQIFDEIASLESQKDVIEMNLKYYDYIDKYFQERNEIELIAPSAMGIEDDLLNSLVDELISLHAEKLSLVKNKQDRSPYLHEISIRIENLQKMIVENIAYYKKTNKNVLDDLSARIKQLNIEASKVPKTQRELLGYERQYQINDELYSYLLEKKAEAEIAKASVQSEAEVLEAASTNGIPVAPKKYVILFFAFAVGIIMPFVILQLLIMLRKSYYSEEEIRNNIDLPHLANIHRNNRKSEGVVIDYPQSSIAESFRKLSTKLSYFLIKDTSKIIGISSTISEEGKSFISLNLALTLANQGSKTILLGFDLRKPKKYNSLEIKYNYGLSEYLSHQVTLVDVIQGSKHKNLDVIWAGEAPPNPFNLISSSSTRVLFEQLQNDYQYIIIDTAPIGLLSDSYKLLNYADLKIIITRIKRTPKKAFQTLLSELQEQSMDNLAYIVNDIPLTKKDKYGYGYYHQKK